MGDVTHTHTLSVAHPLSDGTCPFTPGGARRLRRGLDQGRVPGRVRGKCLGMFVFLAVSMNVRRDCQDCWEVGAASPARPQPILPAYQYQRTIVRGHTLPCRSIAEGPWMFFWLQGKKVSRAEPGRDVELRRDRNAGVSEVDLVVSSQGTCEVVKQLE